jgi:hypothetical protein
MQNRFVIPPAVDPELEAVYTWLAEPDRVSKAAQAVRYGLDDVINGPQTGRFCLDQLDPVEKAYVGYRVEFRYLAALSLAKDAPLDTVISGVRADVKWSTNRFGWMIPNEAVSQVCVLISACDHSSQLRYGVVRPKAEWLTKPNRDQKRSIKAGFRDQILWICNPGPLPTNFFLTLPDDVRDKIFKQPKGQARVKALLRLVVGRPIPKIAIDTVAQQVDAARRIRGGDSGARRQLAAEGIGVLCGTWREDQTKALELGLGKLERGHWLTYRVP